LGRSYARRSRRNITPITSYNVYRAQQGGVSALIGTSTTTSYFDNTVPHAGWYVYSVAGVNTGGEGNIGNAPVIFIGPAEWEPTTYNWFEISGIGTPIPFTADDQNLGPYPIGMTFPYYNAAFFSTFRACTNGFISFTSTSTVYTNAAIPTAAEPNNLISPYWDDLTFSSTGDAYYYYDAANTRCIIEYLHAPHLSYAASDFTFQVILEENGDIIYQYMIVDPSTMTPFPSATVGIENAAGTVGIQCTYNGSGPWEPTANTAVIIYSVGISEPPDVSVVLTPVGLPIVIPPTGGAFNFNISVTNNEPTGTVCGVWTMITIPAGTTVGPFINAPAINFVTPGQNINRDRAQSIPAAAPAGNYVYHAYTGFYPAMIGDEDSFPFSKSADGDGGIPVKDWYCWGEAFPGETGVFAAPDLPSSYVLSDAYPNPFNPITHIGYSLPQRAYVELTVFDVTGRQVTTLVKGWMDAGSHEATFYAQGLASGVYFYRLTAGDFSSVKKMILMK